MSDRIPDSVLLTFCVVAFLISHERQDTTWAIIFGVLSGAGVLAVVGCWLLDR